VLFALFIVCAIDLAIAAVLLFLVGARLRHSARIFGVVLVLVVAFLGGQAADFLWPMRASVVEGADVWVAVIGLLVVATRSVWNAFGQLFFAAYLAAALTYLAFAADVTVFGHLSIEGEAASAALFLLEMSALVLASSFVFETCDVVCRIRHSREFPELDPSYLPMVSLHIAAYNEPPDMLIATIKAVEQIDYPNFELVVIDNNTEDEETWRPVEEYCRDLPRVRFVHVSGLEGYKSGALNLVLREHIDPQAEIVGVIDADYLVDPGWLRATVGYFADPQVAFVQTPQDYRDYEGSAYFTACYDAYRYFFATAMPSRNERNSIIFAGTMGLLRKRLLVEIGGWDEWCITEDAETSLRLLKAGYSGMFVAQSFGRGVMPLTFASLKSQRFRWCFGGMQILRRHWRSLMPWDRSPDNKLTMSQRLDYLFGGLQWMNDLILLGFSVVLLVVAGLLLAGENVAVRPLVGPTLLLPAVILLTGLLRAIWALRHRTRISYGRALLAFANWLSLSFTVARACVEGLIRPEGVFLRTPKVGGSHRLRAALAAARTETLIGAVLWGCAAALPIVAKPTALLVGLMAWQGAVYWTSPLMSWMAQRAQLTPDLERRRRTEERRERMARVLRPVAIGSTGAAAAFGMAFVAILAVGASHAGSPRDPFSVPAPKPGAQGPWGGILVPSSSTAKSKSPRSTTTTTTSPSSSPGSSGSGSSTTTPTTSPPTTVAPTTTTAATVPPTTTAPTTPPTTAAAASPTTSP